MEWWGIIAMMTPVAAPAIAVGAVRYAARSFGLIAVMLLTMLTSAGLCYAISTTRTVGFLAGIVELLASWLLLYLAAAMALGAIGRAIYEGFSRKPIRIWPPFMPLDVIFFCGLSALAVLLSVTG